MGVLKKDTRNFDHNSQGNCELNAARACSEHGGHVATQHPVKKSEALTAHMAKKMEKEAETGVKYGLYSHRVLTIGLGVTEIHLREQGYSVTTRVLFLISAPL